MMFKVVSHELQTMLHAAYSLDTTLCDFFVFPKLKLALMGQHLSDLEGIKMKTSQCLNPILESIFRKCFDD